jgi:hypothetical protein
MHSSMNVMQFLAKEGPLAAFINARDRVGAFLSDQGKFDAIDEAPAGTKFADLWYTWMDAWITKRQSDITMWKGQLDDECKVLASNEGSCWSGYQEEMFTFPAAWYPK